jgi:hypothetical protein
LGDGKAEYVPTVGVIDGELKSEVFRSKIFCSDDDDSDDDDGDDGDDGELSLPQVLLLLFSLSLKSSRSNLILLRSSSPSL